MDSISKQRFKKLFRSASHEKKKGLIIDIISEARTTANKIEINYKI